MFSLFPYPNITGVWGGNNKSRGFLPIGKGQNNKIVWLIRGQRSIQGEGRDGTAPSPDFLILKGFEYKNKNEADYRIMKEK